MIPINLGSKGILTNTITVQTLQTALNSNKPPMLLDVREPSEYAYCHIRNSSNIPLSQLSEKIPKLNPQQQTVLLCHHGMRSMQAMNLLEQHGFKNLANLKGGIDAWARLIDPEMPKY